MEVYDPIMCSKILTIKSNSIFLKWICLSYSETKFSIKSVKKKKKKM